MSLNIGEDGMFYGYRADWFAIVNDLRRVSCVVEDEPIAVTRGEAFACIDPYGNENALCDVIDSGRR